MKKFLKSISGISFVLRYKLLTLLYRFVARSIFTSVVSRRESAFSDNRIRENIEKHGSIRCKVDGRDIDVPLQNEFGRNYPVYATDVVSELFNIGDKEIVMDIGGGGNPLSRADIVVDLYPEATPHRGGELKLNPHQKLVCADVQDLSMFKDKSVDFVFTMQTLEHVEDPKAACEEIMRVGKRGFIDVPRVLADMHMGHPEHKWFIDLIDGVLIFRRKPVVNLDSPIFDIYPMSAYAVDQRVKLLMQYYYRNVSCVQLLWNERFSYKVTEW